MIELGRLEEATEILTHLNNIENFNNVAKNNSVKLNVKTNLARLALMKGDIVMAKAFADEADQAIIMGKLIGEKIGDWPTLLLQAEIAFAEGDVDSARKKAKKVINCTTDKFALARANKLLLR